MTLKASAARKRRRRSLRDEVKSLRRQVSSLTLTLAELALRERAPVNDGRFVQIAPGGGLNTAFALDTSGQVWRYLHAWDKTTRTASDERWIKVGMERRG